MFLSKNGGCSIFKCYHVCWHLSPHPVLLDFQLQVGRTFQAREPHSFQTSISLQANQKNRKKEATIHKKTLKKLIRESSKSSPTLNSQKISWFFTLCFRFFFNNPTKFLVSTRPKRTEAPQEAPGAGPDAAVLLQGLQGSTEVVEELGPGLAVGPKKKPLGEGDGTWKKTWFWWKRLKELGKEWKRRFHEKYEDVVLLSFGGCVEKSWKNKCLKSPFCLPKMQAFCWSVKRWDKKMSWEWNIYGIDIFQCG